MCNNLKHPKWGASSQPLRRLIAPIYENGFNEPVGWNPDRAYGSLKMPSAREVSLKLFKANGLRSDANFTGMVMQWGQFLDHDITLTPMSPSTNYYGSEVPCRESCHHLKPCFNIKKATYDRRLNKENARCMEFIRSAAMCGTGVSSLLIDTANQREQMNAITSFIDASNVYGSDADRAERLRKLNSPRGLLDYDYSQRKIMLPFSQGQPDSVEMDCRRMREREIPSAARVACFMAGDARANEQVGLTTMHTVFLRLHNKMGSELYDLNLSQSGDDIYYTVRKIIGAIMQKITYTEWLPTILGDDGMRKLGEYAGYKPDVNPSITNVFATSAFRFGHSLINPIIRRLDNDRQPLPRHGHLLLHEAFFNPYKLVAEGGIDPIIRGLIFTPTKDRRVENSRQFSPQLIEKLFQASDDVALDLGALNVQRSRDHGLPFYLEWREECGLETVENWADLQKFMLVQDVNALKSLYKDVSLVELYPALLLEKTIPGTRTGPTLQCLLLKQFKSLRDGDRFWYQNPGEFSPGQLAEIENISLGDILCSAGDDIKETTESVFHLNADTLDCENSRKIDLRKWAESCTTPL